MTRTSHQRVLDEANQLGEDLLSALQAGDLAAGAQLAARAQQAGVQSLERLTPRGTLEFPAGNRWEGRLTRELLEHLKSSDLPDSLTAGILNALGYWAGGEASGPIGELLLERLRRGESSPRTIDVVRNGLYALHLIGGPEAVAVLRDFQGPAFSPEVRALAIGYLNELGGRIVDLMFGSESVSEPRSAEEVRCRDSLQDPYDWQGAALGLWEFLAALSRSYWLRHENDLSNRYPPQAGTAIRLAFGNEATFWPDSWEWVRALEPTLPHFMIRLHSDRVMTLEPALRFFPTADLLDVSATPVLGRWSLIRLHPGSASACHLDQLPLFSAPLADGEPGATSHHRVLRNWLGQLVFLAGCFGRHRQAPLVFAMAAMQYHMHEELELPRGLSFPDLLGSMFRNYPRG
jgi:hypothetical protein